ncbi:MAG: hypothetical protein ACFKPT_22755 [Gloeotrichia echinulata GP01]
MGSFGQHNDRSVTTARRLRRLHFGSALLPGIALLVQTLRVACFHVVVRLRSVTRDCTSGADATRSLLPRSGTAPLCYQGLGIGDYDK